MDRQSAAGALDECASQAAPHESAKPTNAERRINETLQSRQSIMRLIAHSRPFFETDSRPLCNHGNMARPIHHAKGAKDRVRQKNTSVQRLFGSNPYAAKRWEEEISSACRAFLLDFGVRMVSCEREQALCSFGCKSSA
jgi:hypothetical protein